MVFGAWVLLAVVVGAVACARIDAAPLVSGAVHATLQPGTPVFVPSLGMYDAVMAQRGRTHFTASCARCHVRAVRKQIRVVTGPSSAVAATSDVGIARVRPAVSPFKALRDLWRHPPYFVDGRAATLAAVVAQYDGLLNLKLSQPEQRDLVEYLKSR